MEVGTGGSLYYHSPLVLHYAKGVTSQDEQLDLQSQAYLELCFPLLLHLLHEKVSCSFSLFAIRHLRRTSVLEPLCEPQFPPQTAQNTPCLGYTAAVHPISLYAHRDFLKVCFSSA